MTTLSITMSVVKTIIHMYLLFVSINIIVVQTVVSLLSSDFIFYPERLFWGMSFQILKT